MEFDRNRYFMIGILLFLLGMQFRMVESFVLNETSTRAPGASCERLSISFAGLRYVAVPQRASVAEENRQAASLARLGAIDQRWCDVFARDGASQT